MTEKDYTLSDEMSSYLCNFVKAQNPNSDSLPLWEKESVMCFGDGKTTQKKPDLKRMIVTTLTNKPVGE